MSDVQIQNVVAVASLNQKIDLLAIMKVFRTAEYRPKRFPGLVYRMKRPKTAPLIFGSGARVSILVQLGKPSSHVGFKNLRVYN